MRPRRELKAQCARYLHHCFKAGFCARRQCLVKTLAAQACVFGYLLNSPPLWDRDLGIRSRSGDLDGCHDQRGCGLDARPTGGAQNNDGDASRGEVLLVLEVCVGGDQHLQTMALGGGK